MALVALTKAALPSRTAKIGSRLVLAAALSSVAFLTALPLAHAGFEWSPPPQTGSAAKTPAPAAMPDLVPAPAVASPLPPVSTQPLSAPAMKAQTPPASAKTAADVPAIDLAPLKNGHSRRARLAALQMAKAAPAAPAIAPAPAKSPDFLPPAKMTPVSAPPPAPSPTPEGAAPVAGFGRDMPLALAMRQLVPANYGFSFAEGVNPGQRISWSGGKSWNETLGAALRPHGMKVIQTPNAVRIEPVSSPPSADIMTPPPVSRPQIRPVVSAMAPRGAMKDVDTELLPDPVPAARTAPASGAPASLIAAPTPAGFPKAMVKSAQAPGPIDMPPVSRREDYLPLPEPVRAVPPAAPIMPIPAATPPSSPPAIVTPPPSTPSMTPVSMPIKHAASVEVFDMNAVRDWSAPAGSTLRRLLTDWSQQAGVQLHWSSQFDYPIQTGIHMTGTYQKAVETVLDGLRDAKPRPLARLHPNLPAGPAVLILQTQNVIN